MNQRLNDQFAKKVAQFMDESRTETQHDERGFEILSPVIYGWHRDSNAPQWLFYKAGRVIAAVTDEVIESGDRSMVEGGIKELGAAPLPKGVWK